MNTDAEVDRLWRAGNLRWKLDDHQLRIYDPYRGWEKRRLSEPKKGVHQLYLGECGRQVGKTYVFSDIRVEDGLDERFANKIIMMGAATEIALKELVIPTINTIIADAPDDVRPKFFTSRWGMRAGYHFPTTDAVIKLVGFEDPDSLRGTGLAGCNISEAAFVPKLAYAVNSIILPMFSRNPEATIVLESSTVRDPNHAFERIFKPDAQRRKAYAFMTLWDNTALSEDTKKSMYEASATINPDEAAREFECKLTMDKARALVPSFVESEHVREIPRPQHACAIAAMDPGMRDLFFAGWGYWHAPLQKLVVEYEWSGRNTLTSVVAGHVREIELEFFGSAGELLYEPRVIREPREEIQRLLRVMSGEEAPDMGAGLGLEPPADGLSWWNGQEFARNPLLRASDTEARLIADLSDEHRIQLVPTEKDDADAALFSLRDGFKLGKILVHPRCVKLIAQLRFGHWNDRFTDWARYTEGMEAELYGHFDGIAMLKYMWRMVQHIRNVDPFPPLFTDKRAPDVMHIPDDWKPKSYAVSDLEAWLS